MWYLQLRDPMAGLLLVDRQAVASLQPEVTLSAEIARCFAFAESGISKPRTA